MEYPQHFGKSVKANNEYRNRFLMQVLFLSLIVIGRLQARDKREEYVSFRFLGLARHLIDVRSNAPYYPVKLDEEAKYVFNPGVLVAYDYGLATKSPLFLRVVSSFYMDCAGQPASYAACYLHFPAIFRGGRWSVGSGLGLAIDLRRNWRKYVPQAEGIRLFHDWGFVEAAIGPYSEIEFLYRLDDGPELVLNVVPGLPVILFLTAGVRMPLSNLRSSRKMTER